MKPTKEKVVFKQDQFVDFKGNTRNFCFCAISTVMDFGNPEINMKRLDIGISIQNEADVYNPSIGKIIAEGKARKKPCGTIISSNIGMINTKVVSALLEQESEYFKENPGKYIAGYNNARDKHLKIK